MPFDEITLGGLNRGERRLHCDPSIICFGSGPCSEDVVAIPSNHDDDIKLYLADGKIVKGIDALDGMAKASLVLWIAGNQFFAMDEVVGYLKKSIRE